MQTSQFSPEIKAALSNAQGARVQEIAKELATLGLAVAMPHLHENDRVRALPADLVQYENDLTVSFRDKEQFERSRRNAFPVMWRFDERLGRVEACAWCHDE